MKKRTLNELRQVKTYGYILPSPSKGKETPKPKDYGKKIQNNILNRINDLSK